MAQQNYPQDQHYTFPQKVWIAGGVLALITVVLLLAKAVFSVLLLLFAAVLIAVFFRGLAGLIHRKTKWNPAVCLVIAIVGAILLLFSLFGMIGLRVQSQFDELSEQLPEYVQNAKTQLNQSAIGRRIVQKISDPETARKLEQFASTFFSSTFGILGDLYIVLFLGIFFTSSPQTYVGGMVQLVPLPARNRARDVFEKLNSNLKKWLKGQLFAMFVIFTLTAIGLLIIGIPLWLPLAILAGLLNFIPNFGPIIAMVPAVLVAFLKGPETALIVGCLYILIQTLESNLITPQVQKKLVDIPPALGIIAQLLIGVFSGGWGLLLATPLILVIMTLVQELYTNPMNEAEKQANEAQQSA
jgi:predicted PurR-regulated permease PerM